MCVCVCVSVSMSVFLPQGRSPPQRSFSVLPLSSLETSESSGHTALKSETLGIKGYGIISHTTKPEENIVHRLCLDPAFFLGRVQGSL